MGPVLRVKIVRGTVGSGGPLGVGQVLDLPDAEARDLIARGKAQLALAPVQLAAPVPQHADPAPSRARGSGT